MSETTLDQLSVNEVVTDEELINLKKELAEKKKQLEYKKLKSDIQEIAFRANNELTEFSGGMKQVDTDRALKSHRDPSSFFGMLSARLGKMMAVRPIMGSIIGIGLTVFGIIALLGFLHNPKIDPYKIYLAYLLESAIAVQVLKSASRSLLLPVIATVIGLVVSNSITEKQLFLQHHQLFYQVFMMIGLTGIAVSVFSID